MNERFAGKVVVVVGGGSNVHGATNGSAAALSYAREGAHVIVADCLDEAAQYTHALISREGNKSSTATADATSSDDVERLISDTFARFGTIDVLHNNVGSTLMGLPPELSLEQWNHAIAVNLNSVFLTCRFVLPVMERQHHGAIVNISSLASMRFTGYRYPAYSAAKAAVNHLTSTLALHYARSGIRINAVVPGLIDSPMIYRKISSEYASVEEMIQARNETSPSGKMGTPWDVAEAALFLASDAASFINGVVLPVDGGQNMDVR